MNSDVIILCVTVAKKQHKNACTYGKVFVLDRFGKLKSLESA